MNGLFKDFLIYGPEDNIYMPFTKKYEYVELTDNNFKKVFEHYSENRNKKNLIIDDRSIIFISYLSFFYNDILIYNTATTEINTLYQYISTKILRQNFKFYTPYRCKSILFLYVFITKICKKQNIQWNIGFAIKATKNIRYIPYAIDLQMIINYFDLFNSYKPNLNNKKSINILNFLTIQDKINYFGSNITENTIIYNIINLTQVSRNLILYQN